MRIKRKRDSICRVTLSNFEVQYTSIEEMESDCGSAVERGKKYKEISVSREGLRFSEQDESPHPTTAVKRGADGVYRRN